MHLITHVSLIQVWLRANYPGGHNSHNQKPWHTLLISVLILPLTWWN